MRDPPRSEYPAYHIGPVLLLPHDRSYDDIDARDRKRIRENWVGIPNTRLSNPNTELQPRFIAMEIYTSTDQIQSLSIFTQGRYPVALTALLVSDGSVLIGMWCEPIGSACIHVDTDKFIAIKHFLYDH
jgi:hypothetical protein